jgi:hypothetical protein
VEQLTAAETFLPAIPDAIRASWETTIFSFAQLSLLAILKSKEESLNATLRARPAAVFLLLVRAAIVDMRLMEELVPLAQTPLRLRVQ